MTNSDTLLEILEEAQSYIDDDELRAKARTVAKGKIKQWALDCLPEKKRIKVPYSLKELQKAYENGFNQAISLATSNIEKGI